MQKAYSAATESHQARVLFGCFKALIKNVETQKKLSMALKIRGVTVTVKAFESLRKNVFFSRLRRDSEVKAMINHATTLKAKALKAFNVVLSRRLLANHVRQTHLVRVTRKTFNAWEDQL